MGKCHVVLRVIIDILEEQITSVFYTEDGGCYVPQMCDQCTFSPNSDTFTYMRVTKWCNHE
jgi:hypothetical protein